MNGIILLSIAVCLVSSGIFYNIGLQKGLSFWEKEYNTLHEKYIKALKDHAQFIRDLRL